jgi:hypothetical protein
LIEAREIIEERVVEREREKKRKEKSESNAISSEILKKMVVAVF